MFRAFKPLKASVFPRPLVYLGAGIGLVLGVPYLADARSGIHEYVFCPMIRQLTSAEEGHKLGIWLMKMGISPRMFDDDGLHTPENLKVTVFGKTLNSPIGLAAGLDKHGEAIESLFNCGFSYVEVGSVTPEPQPGNPEPRFFRLPRDEAVINRYGFNSVGHFAVLANLKMRLARYLRPEHDNFALRQGKLLGINLGKNKFGDEVQDYIRGVQTLGPYADVLVINVSSPNTPGLRDLQNELKLSNLLTTVVAERNTIVNRFNARPPVLVKIAPDLTEPEIESIANAATQSKIDGIIVSNTTVQRPSTLLTSGSVVSEAGGLSGKPIKPYSLAALRLLKKHTKGTGLTLVGCGGISSGKDALEYGKAGADFVQLYTAFAYRGPGLPGKIRDELSLELATLGKTWEEIVGMEAN